MPILWASLAFLLTVLALALAQGLIGARLFRVEPYRTLSRVLRMAIGVLVAVLVFQSTDHTSVADLGADNAGKVFRAASPIDPETVQPAMKLAEPRDYSSEAALRSPVELPDYGN